MKETLNLWATHRLRQPGVLACALRYPDATAFVQSYVPGFPPSAVENACRCVADTFLVLNLNRLPAEQLRWVFEKANLLCARRKDGVYLVLFVSRSQAEAETRELDQAIRDFHNVSPAQTA